MLIMCFSFVLLYFLSKNLLKTENVYFVEVGADLFVGRGESVKVTCDSQPANIAW